MFRTVGELNFQRTFAKLNSSIPGGESARWKEVEAMLLLDAKNKRKRTRQMANFHRFPRGKEKRVGAGTGRNSLVGAWSSAFYDPPAGGVAGFLRIKVAKESPDHVGQRISWGRETALRFDARFGSRLMGDGWKRQAGHRTGTEIGILCSSGILDSCQEPLLFYRDDYNVI